MMNLTFITGNINKAEELKQVLSMPIGHIKLDLDEIQSLDLSEIVEHKAKQAYKKLVKPVLVEDTSLEFEDMSSLPGPFIKWFLKTVGDEGLCKMLKSFPTRKAIGVCMFGYFDGSSFKVFEGKIKGNIAETPRGNSGFGWDTIFIPEGSKETRAEMNAEDKNKFSMRRVALEKLKKYLAEKTNSCFHR